MFLDTARIIYKNDKTWVCPLDNDIRAVFDPDRNTYFKHGEAERWVLTDENNRPAGRIAAFIAGERAGKGDDPEAIKEAKAFTDAGEVDAVVAGARKTHWSAEDPKKIADNFGKKEKTQK